MKRAFQLYLRLVDVQIRSQMQYRSSFVLETLATGIANSMGFITIALVLQRFDQIAGWELKEVAFLFGLIEFSFGCMDMLFSGFDPDFFSLYIRRGTFDQLLLRPVDITLQVFGSRFISRRIGRMIQGFLIILLAISWNDIHWTFAKILYLPVVILSIIAYFGGLFVVGSAITFWTGESIEAMNALTYGGSEMMSYPMDIYPNWMRQFFTFILPAIFVNYYPALYFLDMPDPFHFPKFVMFLAPIAGFGVLVISMVFWNYGIRHYQSTGT